MQSGKSYVVLLSLFVSLLMSGRYLRAEPPFKVFAFESASGKQIPCRLLKPAGYAAGGEEKYSLVLFLHGAGERGDDNESQLIHCTSRFLQDDLRQEHPCFVLAPQCPQDEKWVDVNWSAESHSMKAAPASPLELALEALGSVEQRFRIDADRIYLMGLSMGGYGTWDLICRYPDRFAAAVPICGGGDATVAAKITDVPVWVFHGGNDAVVRPERSRNMVLALKKAGGQPRYTEYPGVGHNSWTPAMSEPGLFEWLFAQRRTHR